MRKRIWLIAALGIVTLLVLARHGSGQDNLDSLAVCRDTQKLLYENAFVRIIDDVIPPGVSEPKHHHPHGIVVAVDDADTETHSFPGGKAARRHTAKGTAVWNEALVHDVTNVGITPTHFIRIDVK